MAVQMEGFYVEQRFYLAAHAPHEIPEWFEPAMEPRPEPPADPKEVIDKIEGPRTVEVNDGNGWSSSPWATLTSLKCIASHEEAEHYLLAYPEFLEWYEAWLAYRHESEAWEKRRQRMRLAEWPWYWADLVLSAGAMTERQTQPKIAVDSAQHRNRLATILLGLCDGVADVMLISGPDKSDPADTYWILRIDVDDEAAEFRFRPEDVDLRRMKP